MRFLSTRLILFLAFISLTSIANSQQDREVNQTDARLFRDVAPNEVEQLKKTGGMVIGAYYLSPSAVASLSKSKILAAGLRRIDGVPWDKRPFSRESAELSVQNINIFLDRATRLYDGTADLRVLQKDVSYVELGDRQLAGALQSLKLGAVWNVALKPGQVARLGTVITRRCAIDRSESN